MISEGIVTTINDDGSINISPMGPIVDRQIEQLCLRPYQTSRTYRNLKRTGRGVFHVTDDVELLAHCALATPEPMPALVEISGGDCLRLSDTCRWYLFRVVTLDDTTERTTITCQIEQRGRVRDFWGFNRAKHACVEAAILATRVGILPAEEILQQFSRLEILVGKTGGDQEKRAFAYLKAAVADRLEWIR